MKRFEHKAVVITGAGSGLGRAAAERIGSEGADLMLVDIDENGLAATARDIEVAGGAGRVVTAVVDVADEVQVRGYIDATVREFGSVDGFFNNAGIEGANALTAQFATVDFARVLSINLNGVFFGMAAALEVMHRQGHGAIVNTASVGGIRGIGNQAGYAAAKHGVVGLTRNAAVEYGQFGISINAIAPGSFLTPMVEAYFKRVAQDKWQDVAKEVASVNPMQRLGKASEVGALIAFLLSGEAPYINGAVITIDGGQATKWP